jgi:hypothetical protein
VHANFNDIDFAEFLFFPWGAEARDDRFWVRALALAGNGIHHKIRTWSPFFHFLLNVRLIDIRKNDVAGPTSFPEGNTDTG